MRAPLWTRCVGSIVVSCMPLGSGARGEPPDPDAQTPMVEIVEALQVVIPLSLNEERFGDPASRAAVDGALGRLADNTARLAIHGADREPGFAHLSESLARDSLEIRERFAAGRADEARFLLRHLLETCAACHSRLPDERRRDIGRELTENPAIASLPREERVQLQIATRQFERALATYELLFADPDASIDDLDLSGDLENYLEICLRVQRDPARAISNLERLAAREDLPRRLRPHVEAWVEALRALGDGPEGGAIERARELIEPVLGDSRVSGTSELVRLIAASGLLHRYAAATADPPARVGEAYYLLGVIESHMGRSFWASQTQFFLETAIRMGPSERYAEEAFALLEAFTISGYTGSSGTHVPPEVLRRLAALDELMKRARTAQRSGVEP